MNKNDNPLIDAIKSNNRCLVASLIADGSADVNARMQKPKNGTLLWLAAKLGRVEIAALLLDAGARIDDVNDSLDTACHVAVIKGRILVVRLLVARNANVSLRNQSNQTPLTIAINKTIEPLVTLLIDAAMASNTPPDDATLCVAATVSIDVIRSLLFKYRIDLSAIRDNRGRTALHRAIWRMADANVVGALIEVAGIDVDAREENNITAVHAACLLRDVGALTRLVAAGANLELADNNGDTPLHYSRDEPTEQSAVFLLAVGANVNAKNNSGRTACHQACALAHASLPALLALGADLDEPDNDGVTPRQLLKTSPPTDEEIALARRRVLNVQLSFVRKRSFEVCVALQSLGLDALCLCEILQHSCGPVAPFVPFHIWWQIATSIKHWRQ
jgi:ankyrin repeat protein